MFGRGPVCEGPPPRINASLLAGVGLAFGSAGGGVGEGNGTTGFGFGSPSGWTCRTRIKTPIQTRRDTPMPKPMMIALRLFISVPIRGQVRSNTKLMSKFWSQL